MTHVAKIVGEENLVKAFEELYHVMVNLRSYTLEWEHRYGGVAKSYKKYWEERADKILEELESGNYTPSNNFKKNGTTMLPENKNE